ncbi:YphA family membrane protein [Rossellomorea sp. NRS-1567]|uniref:YphA family membrane protein n=1 Tax=Rossellomorea sp. NRS-1567 TaxID=3233901 RepID=UPI003D2DAFBC
MMVDGILYLWLIWGIWIFTTFMMNKTHPYRFHYSFICLVLICVFPYGLKVSYVEVAVPVIVLGLICIHYIRILSLKDKLYMLVAILAMGMLYAGIGLLAIYDPVLMFLDRDLIMAVSLAFLSILFYTSSSFMLRMIAIAGSSIVGEVFMSIPLKNIGFLYPIGGPVYLDVLAISTGILLAIKLFEEINQLFNIKVQTNKGEMKNL